MNKLLSTTLALAAGAVVNSHAIFGIGGHWAPSPGLEVARSTDTVASAGGRHFIVDEKGTTGLNGFGLKVWIDALPIIDVEATGNLQFGEYSLTMTGPNSTGGTQTVDVNFDFGVPLVPTEPVFFRSVNDLTITYPFLSFPPTPELVHFYAGAGLSYVISSAVLDAEFATQALADANFDEAAGTADAAAEAIAKALIDEGLNMGVGFHVVLGARASPPIIPLAAYANLKYHFGGNQAETVDAASLTIEIGGGLAF